MNEDCILVTGANGFVGSALCVDLIKREYTVRAALRDPARFAIADCEIVRVPTIEAGIDWTEALHGMTTVIHLAARVHVMHDDVSNPLEEFRRVNVAGTEHLARSAAASGVKRFVYVSSIKVNGEGTDPVPTLALPYKRRVQNAFTELSSPHPQDPYGVSKYEAEQALHRIAAETGLEVVIVRPPLVYGAGVKGNFAQMIKVLTKGIPLPLASVNNLRSLVYVENLVDALILCATHPGAAGQTYLVSDGEDVSTPQLVRAMAGALHRSSRVFAVPIALMRYAAKLVGKSAVVDRLTQSLVIDSSKIRNELGWQPPYTMAQGLQATAEWYRQSVKPGRA